MPSFLEISNLHNFKVIFKNVNKKQKNIIQIDYPIDYVKRNYAASYGLSNVDVES